MSDLREAALAYAARGIPVFPLKPRGKTPLTTNGFKDATTDQALVESRWRQWPDANIGIPTGATFDVLDLDGPDAVSAITEWADRNGTTAQVAIGARPRVQTGRGYHYLVAPTGCGNRAALLPHVDFRGVGGYVVAPPSIHETGVIYTWQVPVNGNVPPATDLLRTLIDPPKHLATTANGTALLKVGVTPYGEKALNEELGRLARAQEGTRNETLFKVAANVNELVAGGELPPSAMDDVRLAALRIGLDEREAERTLTSAAQRASVPRSAPNGAPSRGTPGPSRALAQRGTQAVARTRPEDDHDDDASIEAELPPFEPDRDAWQGFPGWFVDRTDEWTEASPVATIATLLCAAGASMGPAPHVVVGNTRHPLLVWPLVLGRTASGRKGTALSLVKSILQQADPEFDAANLTSGLSSGEGLVFNVRDPELEPEEYDTGEGARTRKVRDEGVTDKRRLVVETEFTSVLARAKREGNTLAAVLRQAWDGDNLSVLTKASYKATRPHIALIAHATPKEFIRRLREEELAGGTYNRLLPVASRQSKRLPHAPPVPPDVMGELASELRSLLQNARKVMTWIARTPEANELWADELYSEFTSDDEEDERVGQFVARAAPYCLRLAALYALLDGRQAIDVAHLRAGAALVRYSMMTVRHLYNVPQVVTPAEERLRQALLANGPMAKAQLFRTLNGNYRADALDRMLTDIGAVSRQEPTRGRPRTVYSLENE